MTSLLQRVRQNWCDIAHEDPGALAMLAQQAHDAANESLLHNDDTARRRLRMLQRSCRMALRPVAPMGESS